MYRWIWNMPKDTIVKSRAHELETVRYSERLSSFHFIFYGICVCVCARCIFIFFYVLSPKPNVGETFTSSSLNAPATSFSQPNLYVEFVGYFCSNLCACVCHAFIPFTLGYSCYTHTHTLTDTEWQKRMSKKKAQQFRIKCS